MYNVGDHIIETLRNVRNDKILRLTMLMHDIGKPETMLTDDDGVSHFYGHELVSAEMAGKIMRRLKFDRDTMDRVCNLIRFHDERYPAEPAVIRRAMHRVGEKDFPLLFEVRYADTMAQSTYMRREKLQLIEDAKAVYEKIVRDRDCVSLKSLAVGGRDLIALGIQPGRSIGVILNAMLSDVIDEPEHNNKDYLLEPERLKNVFMKDL